MEIMIDYIHFVIVYIIIILVFSQSGCVELLAGLDLDDPKVKPSSSANAIYSLASR